MADLFAPKLQADIAYERPVEVPSALGALAGLGEAFIDQYTREANAAKSSRSSGPDPNLAVFQQGLERIEAIREEKGESAALIQERTLAKNFAAAGIEFDTDFQNVYTTTTGRPWAGYGRDTQTFMMEEALNDPDVQASYIASFVALPKDATNDQRIEYAIGQKATLQAAADVIARSKAEGGYNWTVQTEAAYGQALDTFVDINMGALVQATQSGQRVGPQALANLQAQWSQYKVQLSRPTGITDDQWDSTQSKITNIDNMFQMLTKASSSDVLFEEITTALSSALLEEGDGSTQSILAAASAIKDPVSLSNLLGADVQNFIMDVSKGINLDVTQPQLFGHILTDTETPLGSDIKADPTLKSLPPEVEAKISGLSPEQHFDALKASGKLTSLINNNSLQRPEGRQQFVENAASIGAVMMTMENDEFLSASFLRQLVANPNFIQNIKNLEGVDPEGAAVVRTYVRSGLNTELVRQQRNVGAIEQGLGAVWDGDKYIITRESIMQKSGYTEDQADRFLAWVSKTYKLDTKALAEGTVPLPDDLGFNPTGLTLAYDRRESIKVINETLNALSETPEVTLESGPAVATEEKPDESDVIAQEALETVNAPVDGVQTTVLPDLGTTRENPFIIEKGNALDETKAYDDLPSGSFFIDPLDGKTYRKP